MERIPRKPLLGDPLAAVVRQRLGAGPWPLALVEDFLATTTCSRPVAASLLALARNRAEPWTLRNAAMLMLEHQILLSDEPHVWRDALGADDSLLPRLERLNRLHARIRGFATTPQALDDFLAMTRRDCRIAIARYIRTPDEVVAEIERHVRRSRGMPADVKYVHPDTEEEVAHQIETLPEFEREIVARLMRGPVIRWVADATPGEINSLVEYPLGSVVLVIKPPGSEVEIEIKRAGIRGPRPFDIRIWREGKRVPRSHHLQGGSMVHLLQWESCQSAFFSRVYRQVHGEDAAMSRTLQIASIFGIPSRAGELQPVDYFTRSEVFDKPYGQVHGDLHFIADILTMKDPRAPVARTPKPQNPVMTAARFLGVTRPAQAIQIGNSAFRLDKLAHYLAPGGADEYFKQGLQRDYAPDDARRFADELLDEVLSVYEPPGVAFRTYRQYVGAAFRVPANRKRARENFLSVMRQIGRFWGTLYAAGGHTDGESFVGRNTGLRTVFEDGAWTIRITFMDNDGMTLIGRTLAWFHPRGTLADQRGDHNFIFGRNTKAVRMKGAVGFLQMIYRVDYAGRRAGVADLQASMREAYDATRAALRVNPELRERFNGEFLDRLDFWHDVVSGYLRTNRSRPERRRWRRATEQTMVAREYPDELRDEHFSTLRRRSRLLHSLKFLYV